MRMFAALTGAVAVVLAAWPLAAQTVQAEVASARQAQLRNMVAQDCGSCHGLTMKGGLGPPLRPADLAGKDVDGLVDTILYGRPGTPMPPWDFEISRDEAAWLVERLLKGETGG